MKKKVLDAFNKARIDYLFCGMIKLKGVDGLFYTGYFDISNTFEEEFEVTINSMDDFVLLSEWLPDDYANAIDGELENRNFHNYNITPYKILSAMPESVTDAEKITILKTLYDWLIPTERM